jgi:RNA polymerase sigma-70 factor (ECF subfamily)
MVITNDLLASADHSELLARARQGDPDAFCLLAQSCETRLFRQAMALCRDETMAEDLVVETITEAWRSLGRYRGRCRFSTWLYAILLHRHQKRARTEQRQPVPFSRLPSSTQEFQVTENTPTAQPTPFQETARAELVQQLETAIATLPNKHQQVLLLRFFEQASLAEIASALDCSVGTVKSRLHHALEKLRRLQISLNLPPISGDV